MNSEEAPSVEAIERIRMRATQRNALLKRIEGDTDSWASDKTLKTYTLRIREYLEYCDELDIPYTIHQSSLETYIRSRVVGRRIRSRGGMVPECVGLSTVSGYISALSKLWEIQVCCIV